MKHSGKAIDAVMLPAESRRGKTPRNRIRAIPIFLAG